MASSYQLSDEIEQALKDWMVPEASQWKYMASTLGDMFPLDDNMDWVSSLKERDLQMEDEMCAHELPSSLPLLVAGPGCHKTGIAFEQTDASGQLLTLHESKIKDSAGPFRRVDSSAVAGNLTREAGEAGSDEPVQHLDAAWLEGMIMDPSNDAMMANSTLASKLEHLHCASPQSSQAAPRSKKRKTSKHKGVTQPVHKSKVKKTSKYEGATQPAALSAQRKKSKYKGVTPHVKSGLYEAHIWNGDAQVENRAKKGKQEYCGHYFSEVEAARVHDRAALKLKLHLKRKRPYKLNFPICNYEEDLVQMKNVNTEDYIWYLKRNSQGFSRGSSRFTGVYKNRCKWEARVAYMSEAKAKVDVYLGVYDDEIMAAHAHDLAALHYHGWNAKPISYPAPTARKVWMRLQHLSICVSTPCPKASDPPSRPLWTQRSRLTRMYTQLS